MRNLGKSIFEVRKVITTEQIRSIKRPSRKPFPSTYRDAKRIRKIIVISKIFENISFEISLKTSSRFPPFFDLGKSSFIFKTTYKFKIKVKMNKKEKANISDSEA